MSREAAAAGSAIERFEIMTARGRLLAAVAVGEISRARGRPTVCVTRADLLWQSLANALGEPGVLLGSECVGFAVTDGGVTAQLADAPTEDADVLVGADGRDSVIRRQLLGDDNPHLVGISSWSGVIPFEHPRAPTGLMRSHIGRGRQFIFHPCGGGRSYWSAELRWPAGAESPELSTADLLRHYQGFPEPVAAMIEATPESAIVKADLQYRKPVTRWGEGPVTLLGDAAHLMTPNTGQGANPALEDAVVLARRLQSAAADPAAALRAYEAVRQPRTAKVTRAAVANTRMLRLSSPLACATRDAFMGIALPRLLGNQVRDFATWAP